MSDVELFALAVRVQAEIHLQVTMNADRAARGYAPAYGEDVSVDGLDELKAEIAKRMEAKRT